MTRFTIASILAATIMLSANLKAEDASAEFKLQPIGHVKKADGHTMIVLDEKHQPGLLGLDGFSHIYTFWWFDKNCAQREMFAALAIFLARVIAFLRHDGLADSR